MKCLNLCYFINIEVNEVKLVLQAANYFRSCAWKFGRKIL